MNSALKEMHYRVAHCALPPSLNADWADPGWTKAETIEVASFRPESSSHRPRVQARLMWSEAALHGIFKVADQFVRCTRRNYFDEVWKDSCVELFLQPQLGKGYFNFEFNCGGAHLCYYITDHTRAPGGFARAEKLPPEIGLQVKTRSTLPPIIDPEISEPIVWFLQFQIPLSIIEHYVGRLGNPDGQHWRGNFFKCAEEVSHPHWASWSPVDEFNFHLPRCFGTLAFETAP